MTVMAQTPTPSEPAPGDMKHTTRRMAAGEGPPGQGEGDLGERSGVGTSLFREMAMERPDTAYNQENEHDKRCRWIYNHKNKCDAAICITAEVMKRITKIGKVATKHALGVYVKDISSSWLLVSVDLPTTWAELHDVYTALAKIKDNIDESKQKHNPRQTIIDGDFNAGGADRELYLQEWFVAQGCTATATPIATRGTHGPTE